MAPRKLEINWLASDGELLRRLVCVRSRVNVLRSVREETLNLFRDAIAGKTIAERFSILLDGQSFNPEEHIFIGFGESFGLEAHSSVAEFLLEAGMPEEVLEPVLLGHGLGGCGDQRCGSLSAGEQKLLRILAATQKSDKVIVLDKPLEDLQPQWSEALAKHLIDFVCKSDGLILVTNLTVRPEFWVDNPYIARLQLERPRKLTIGAGSGQSASGEVRDTKSLFIPPNALDEPPPAAPAVTERVAGTASAKTRFAALSFVGLVFAFVAFVAIALPRHDKAGKQKGEENAVAAVAISQPANASIPANRTTPPQKREGLNSFPPEIRNAVLQAFDDAPDRKE